MGGTCGKVEEAGLRERKREIERKGMEWGRETENGREVTEEME